MSVTFAEIWQALDEVKVSERSRKIGAGLVLVKFGDGLVQGGAGRSLSGLNLAAFSEPLHHISQSYMSPLFRLSETFTSTEAENIVSMVRLCFDILQSLLNDPNISVGSGVLNDLTEKLICNTCPYG
jgi:hypothetical protein